MQVEFTGSGIYLSSDIPHIPKIGDFVSMWNNGQFIEATVDSIMHVFNEDGTFHGIEINVTEV